MNQEGTTRGEQTTPRETKPPCRLVGEDGNVFNVIGRVRRALNDAGQGDRAREFVRRAMAAQSYDEVLGLCWEYVDVR